MITSIIIIIIIIIIAEITHKRVYGCRPNVVGMGNGWPFGIDPNPDVDFDYFSTSIIITRWGFIRCILTQQRASLQFSPLQCSGLDRLSTLWAWAR